MAQVERIVAIHLPGAAKPVPAGRLTLIEEGRNTLGCRFSYGRRYLARANAVPVDPFHLPLDADAGRANHAPLNGLVLFGAIRDATPDAWGRRVIENRLRAEPDALPESAFLDGAGSHRFGALDIWASPEAGPSQSLLPNAMELEHLVEAAERIEAGLPVPAHLETIFEGGPSVGGARPKAVLADDGRQWIAKFPARGDPFDIACIERATLELARVAGIDVPETRLLRLADGRNVMLIERFDRAPESDGYAPRHAVSALTALGVDEMDSPRMAYADIARAIERFGAAGRVQPDREELFRRMVFNVLVSNDDDHLRNHALLHSAAEHGWRLSPLYDVVPRPSASQERFLHLAVGPRGRESSLANALEGAAQFHLDPVRARQLVDELVKVVQSWREVFAGLGVPERESDKVASAFSVPGSMHRPELFP